MSKLIENKSIVKRDPRHKIYCHEPYAQKMYDAMCDHAEGKSGLVSKDFKDGQIVQGKIESVSDKYITVDLVGQTIYMDYGKELKFFNKQNTSPAPGMEVDVMITDASTSTGSVEKAFGIMLRQELFKSIKSNGAAYQVTVTGINDGGFIVDLNGLSCFMPGSLAAANKINDFESLLGKQVYVMVENYLEKSDMFVVSVKKYIKHILPAKIKEFNYTDTYKGHVTGVTKYGVFVEWDEIFTGLLHESEIEGDWASIKTGDEIEFYIKEIREHNRIILSQMGPNPEVVAYLDFKDKYEGSDFKDGEIKDIKPFGVFIKMGDVTGMMTPKEFRKYPRLTEGDIIGVHIKQVDPSTKKVYLRQPEPDLNDRLDDLKNSFN